MLNGVDGDTDLEPSPGFSNGGYRPEDQTQEGIGFYMNYNHGPDLEDEHCGAESGMTRSRTLMASTALAGGRATVRLASGRSSPSTLSMMSGRFTGSGGLQCPARMRRLDLVVRPGIYGCLASIFVLTGYI